MVFVFSLEDSGFDAFCKVWVFQDGTRKIGIREREIYLIPYHRRLHRL